jgi:hypothetical protein
MASVFISYARSDVALVRSLEASLTQRGLTVWRDNRIGAADEFLKTIEDQLGKADAVLVVWTEASVSSAFVQAEALAAQGSEKLVPVRVESLDIKSIPFIFRIYNILTVDEIDSIVEAIAAKADARGAPETQSQPTSAEGVAWLLSQKAEIDAEAAAKLGLLSGAGTAAAHTDLQNLFASVADEARASTAVRRAYALEHGIGVDRNDREAARLYQAAANKGDTFAMLFLAKMYSDGRGVAQSDEEAAKLYWRAANDGDTSAMVNLGRLYDQGSGVGQDSRTAAHWILKALQNGDERAREMVKTNPDSWSLEFRRSLQQQLKDDFWYDGLVDGHFGPDTAKAVDDAFASHEKAKM